MAAIPPLTVEEQLELQQLLIDFAEYQQYSQDRFSMYRGGEQGHSRSFDDIVIDFQSGLPARLNRILARQVPRANYTQLTDHKRRLLEPTAEQNRNQLSYRNRDAEGVNLSPGQQNVARNQFQRATAMMPANKNFAFVKILGAGGNGMVVLWKWTPWGNPAEQGHYVVMKLTTEVDANGAPRHGIIDGEKRLMYRLRRAPHIVQVFQFEPKLPALKAGKASSVAQHNIARALQRPNGLLFMEFAKLGDLHHVLGRLASADRHLPPEALWLIFDCLVKACIAMEYPPRFTPAGGIAPRDGDFLPEVVPPGGSAAPVTGFRGIVHFDLDPKNIFLFGYDPRRGNPVLDPPHTQVPRFQVGDFGIAEENHALWLPVNYPNSNALDQAERRMWFWQQREMAKDGWFLPEQFTGEWDLLDRDPEEGPLNAPPGTWPAWNRWPLTSGPGRYSHRSNIWHVGLNMWCLLLLQRPEFPALAGRMKSEEPAIVPPAADVPIEDQRWTYGYRLIADDDEGEEYREEFTPALCETIAKCMMARQEHRPDLNQLQTDITNALGNPLPQLDARVRRFFGAEATPPVPWRSAYTDVDLLHMDPFNPFPHDEGEDVDPPTPNPRKRKRRRTRQAPLEDLAYRN